MQWVVTLAATSMGDTFIAKQFQLHFDFKDSCVHRPLCWSLLTYLVGIDLFVAAQVDPVEPWAAAGGTSSNNQSDLRYIIIIPPHRKRPTQQSWYILVALNVKCSYKGWKSCSIKNPNCKPLWLLLIWQRGSWDNQSYSCYIIITQTHRKRQSIVTKPPETMAEERLPTNDGGAHIFIIKLLQLCISYQFWYCMGTPQRHFGLFYIFLSRKSHLRCKENFECVNTGFELKRTFGEVEKWS